MEIVPAEPSDAAEILALQYAAYQSEALLYDDAGIPPLRQTEDELRQDILDTTVLKAVDGDRIVGSVRAKHNADACYIGRLIVAPERQRQGIGTRLIAAIEAAFPDAARFELFTGHRSEGNLRLYRRLGYRRVGEQPVHDGLTLVYMVKSKENDS